MPERRRTVDQLSEMPIRRLGDPLLGAHTVYLWHLTGPTGGPSTAQLARTNDHQGGIPVLLLRELLPRLY